MGMDLHVLFKCGKEIKGDGIRKVITLPLLTKFLINSEYSVTTVLVLVSLFKSHSTILVYK